MVRKSSIFAYRNFLSVEKVVIVTIIEIKTHNCGRYTGKLQILFLLVSNLFVHTDRLYNVII